MTVALFVVGVIAIPLALGSPLARCTSMGRISPAARAAVAWAGGTVILAVVLTVSSALGVAWRTWPVALAAALAVGIAARKPRPGNRPEAGARKADRPGRIAAGLAVVVALAGIATFAGGGATSADLSYVWGAKAAHFAIDRGIDFDWVRLPHLIHLHPNYPPLWPVTLAWGAMIAGSMPWTAVPVLTLFYVIATALIISSLMSAPLGRRGSALTTCLWFAVLTGSTLRSFSGGSAEGPLLLLVTVAVTVLITEERDEPPSLRWLAAGALAGAVLTKSEGSVAAILVIAGTAFRDWTWRRADVVRSTLRLAAPALAMIGLWAAVRVMYGLPLTDPIRETAMDIHVDDIEVILKVCARLLLTGTLWVGWLVPLVAVASARPVRPLRALPGLLVALGLPAFAAAYYLHAAGNPLELIVWTFPRLIQPAISAWILCAGLLCFSGPETTTGTSG